MQTLTAYQAKTRFGALLDMAQRGPVRVTRHTRVVGVMVSAQDFDAMCAFYADRLQQSLVQSADTAAFAGLTAEALDVLLAHER